MKKKIFSLGLVLVLLVSSLMLSAAPAAGAELTFSNQGIPGALFNQVLTGSDVALVKVAPNGDIFAVDSAGVLSGVPAVYKSTNGGRTWTTGATAAVAQFPGGSVIADIEISPSYETDNRVFVLVAGPPAQVYISTNGGLTFNVLGGSVPAAEVGTSLAVSPSYSAGAGEVMVGTADPAGAAFGNVYIWDRFGVQNWIAQLPTGPNTLDVYEVGFSPNYPIDATMVVITCDEVNTFLHSRVASLAWDSLGGPVTITDGAAAAIAAPATAAIAFPSDFNASLQFNRTLYAAVTSGSANDKIYRIVAAFGSTALDPNTLTGANDDAMTSIAYNGTHGAGTLLCGAAASTAVYRSTNAYPLASAVTVSFLPAFPGPTGAALTYVAMPPDFASSNTVYVGTTGPDSALSVSDTGGATFYQAGMIATTIANIEEFVPASPTDLFLVTTDGAGTNDSVWRSLDGGLSWYRVLATVLTVDPTGPDGILRVSPDYATDKTVYLADTNNTGIQLSNDGGTSWVGRISPVNIGDVAVKDQYTLYVGSAAGGQVYVSVNGAFFWGPPSTITAAAYDLKLDLGTGHIMVGMTNGTAVITTNNMSTWTPLGGAGTATGQMVVGFDANYATNNTVYTIDNGGAGRDAGVFRRTTAMGDAFAAIDGGVVLLPGDISVAPDGAVYVTDMTVTAAGAGGLWRSISPTAPLIPGAFGVAASWQQINAATLAGLTAGDVLAGLSLTEGSNIIYAVSNAGGPNTGVRTYTDTLSVAAPAQTAPQNAAVIASPTTAMLMWDAVPGALGYQVQIDRRADFATAPALTAVAFPLTSSVQATLAGFTYYWRVRVSAPVFGPWSESQNFLTQLAPGGVNAPGILGPAAGGTNAGGYDAPLMPTFQWGTVPGSTGYEFELATDAAMSNVIISEILTTTAYQATMALDYSTTYYWRVRGVSATSETAWSPITAFTTMDEPVAVEPGGGDVTVNVPTQEPPEIVISTQPPPQITVTTGDGEGVAPGYIWAVIIIGAVLVIAVIVLIVRTRRQV
jgi:hypothetical protein